MFALPCVSVDVTPGVCVTVIPGSPPLPTRASSPWPRVASAAGGLADPPAPVWRRRDGRCRQETGVMTLADRWAREGEEGIDAAAVEVG